MIVFELICTDEHRFEGWFGSAEAFEHQRKAGLLVCPVCSSAAVEKLPSARIRRGPHSAPQEMPSSASASHNAVAQRSTMTLASFIDQVLRSTEDVGARFPEEARKIHREEAPRRGIRGITSPEEAEALADEGIAVFPLPIPPPEEWQ